MGFLEKIETAINRLLFLLGDAIVRLIKRMLPARVQSLYAKLVTWWQLALTWIKELPAKVKTGLPLLIAKVKSNLLSFDYKAKILDAYKAGIEQYSNGQPGAKVSNLKKTVLAPFLILGQWLSGLTATQSLVLMGFTAASILSGISIYSTGHRLLNQQSADRTPASVEEVSYDRPDYYKKQNRHVEFTSIRLPVYFANVNEIRSVDIDFTATLSNRLSKLKLEKLEFQFRDHLVLNIEPMVASFPLEEEGKMIIRDKLIKEINEFLISREIDGHVTELKLTYILAN
jgi:hypothetical protein